MKEQVANLEQDNANLNICISRLEENAKHATDLITVGNFVDLLKQKLKTFIVGTEYTRWDIFDILYDENEFLDEKLDRKKDIIKYIKQTWNMSVKDFKIYLRELKSQV